MKNPQRNQKATHSSGCARLPRKEARVIEGRPGGYGTTGIYETLDALVVRFELHALRLKLGLRLELPLHRQWEHFGREGHRRLA